MHQSLWLIGGHIEGAGTDLTVVQFSTAVIAPAVSDQLERMGVGIQYLKTNYLFGLDLSDDDGNPFPDEMFISAIRYATTFLEEETRLADAADDCLDARLSRRGLSTSLATSSWTGGR